MHRVIIWFLLVTGLVVCGMRTAAGQDSSSTTGWSMELGVKLSSFHGYDIDKRGTFPLGVPLGVQVRLPAGSDSRWSLAPRAVLQAGLVSLVAGADLKVFFTRHFFIAPGMRWMWVEEPSHITVSRMDAYRDLFWSASSPSDSDCTWNGCSWISS